MPYPVTVTVEPRTTGHNKLTTALRPILAIPHALLVGPVYWSSRTGGAGLLGAAAYLMAIVSWFTLLTIGEHVHGIREFSLYYLRWRTRNLAYMGLFADAYPPFGDGAYAATIDVTSPPVPRDRTMIAVRLLVAIPHLILLFFLMFGWFVTTAVAWFAILLTGVYPASLYPFGVGVMRWMLRVEAYLLLLVDEYPPFSLDQNKERRRTLAIDDLTQGTYVVDSMVLDEISVNAYGDVAVAFTSQEEKSRYAAKGTSGHYHYTDVWVKKDGRWQVVASHGSHFDKGH